MIAYGGKELASGFRAVRKNTIQVAEDIPETHYHHVPAPDCRSVWPRVDVCRDLHSSLGRDSPKATLGQLVGVNFLGMLDQFAAEEAKPRSKAEIIELLRTEGEQFAAWLDTLTPEFLAEMVSEGDGKTNTSRLDRLLSAKEHENAPSRAIDAGRAATRHRSPSNAAVSGTRRADAGSESLTDSH